jgi:hypothetical protein
VSRPAAPAIRRRTAVLAVVALGATVLGAAACKPTPPETTPPCPAPDARQRYLCDIDVADIAALPGASGVVMVGAGAGQGLTLVEDDGRIHRLGFGAAAVAGDHASRRDRPGDPACRTPPDPHRTGLVRVAALDAATPGTWRLAALARGARDAIELWDLDLRKDAAPALTWLGCIPTPPRMVVLDVTAAVYDTVWVVARAAHKGLVARAVDTTPTVALAGWSPARDWQSMETHAEALPFSVLADEDGNALLWTEPDTGRIHRLGAPGADVDWNFEELTDRPLDLAWSAPWRAQVLVVAEQEGADWSIVELDAAAMTTLGRQPLDVRVLGEPERLAAGATALWIASPKRGRLLRLAR